MDLLPKTLSKYFLSLIEEVLRGMLPQVRHFVSHFLTQNIPAVTHILEGLNPNDPSMLDCPH